MISKMVVKPGYSLITLDSLSSLRDYAMHVKVGMLSLCLGLYKPHFQKFRFTLS